ncbi:MAG: VCBS repeat-containing protein [Elusimicrobiota bacterium]|nr:VCBS repeat-containing protein [Elusimicrobiota bacterium]
MAEPPEAQVKLKNGQELTGVVTGFETNAFILSVQGEPATIPLMDIERLTFNKPALVSIGVKIEGQINIPGIKGYSNLKTGDWDGDGLPELFAVNGGKLQVLSGEGKVLGEKAVGTANINLLADVDNDKKDEVFISWTAGADLIIAVIDQNMKELKRFKAEGRIYNGRPDSGISAAALVDLNQDGKKELLAQVTSGYGWKPRGVYCFDWETAGLLWKYNTGGFPVAPVAADINGDGLKEVVFGSYSPGNGNTEADGTDDGHCYLYAVSNKGKLLWVKELGDYFTGATPLLADLDGDGTMEIFARIEAGPDFREDVGRLLRLDKDGKELARFDAGSTLYACEAAGLNGDKKKAIICPDRQGNIYLLDKDLKVLTKRSLGTTDFESIMTNLAGVQDLDRDGKPEIILTYSERKFVSGRNPRSDGGESNVRHYYNNSVLVLDSGLKLKARYVAAEEWKVHPGFSALAADLNGDKKPELLSLADKAVVLQLTQ